MRRQPLRVEADSDRHARRAERGGDGVQRVDGEGAAERGGGTRKRRVRFGAQLALVSRFRGAEKGREERLARVGADAPNREVDGGLPLERGRPGAIEGDGMPRVAEVCWKRDSRAGG